MENLLYYKCGIPSHTSSKYFSDKPLSQVESTHLRNFYQRQVSNCDPDFPILRQIQNNQNFLRDEYHSNNNPITTQSKSVIAKNIRPVQSYRFHGQGHKLAQDNYEMNIQYNSYHASNSNDDTEFVNVDLPCNKLSVQLLANKSATRTKKQYINKIDKKVGQAPKTNVTQEKRVLIKFIGKKSSKTSIFISDFMGKSLSDIQAFFINTNIVILAL